jgi:hypothetical protein
MGSGLRCRASVACGFRIIPASGSDTDLDEAVRLVRAHEAGCRFRGLAGTPRQMEPRNMDDRLTQQAIQRAELADQPRTRSSGSFHCTCVVCGDRFQATGPRSLYCPKASCRARKGERVHRATRAA